MNRFDFYAIRATSSRKRDLIKAGADPEFIVSATTYQRVGTRSYPRRSYTANLAFVDAGPTARAQVDEQLAKAKSQGLNATAVYYARD